jgi:hypothetical protein
VRKRSITAWSAWPSEISWKMRAHSALLSAAFGSTGRAWAGAGGVSTRGGGGLRAAAGLASAAAVGWGTSADDAASRAGRVVAVVVAAAGVADAAGATIAGVSTRGVATTGVGAGALGATTDAAGAAVTAGGATVGVAVVVVPGGVGFGQSANAASAATTIRPMPPATSGILLDEAGTGAAGTASVRIRCSVAGTSCRVGS